MKWCCWVISGVKGFVVVFGFAFENPKTFASVILCH